MRRIRDLGEFWWCEGRVECLSRTYIIAYLDGRILPLYLKREKITQERQTFTIVVDKRPTRGGIDPYNKLIDRISDDNMIDVTEK